MLEKTMKMLDEAIKNRTPEEQKATDDYISDFRKKQQDEKLAVESISDKILELCNGKAPIDKVLSATFNKIKCPEVYIEWTIDRFWSLQMPKLLEDLNKIYDACFKRKITEKKDLSFNDLDDHVFYIPNKTKKVIVHTGQSHRHLYVWDKKQIEDFRELHIRNFYDVWEQSDDDDEYEKECMEDFINATKKHGYQPAINQLNGPPHSFEEYADDQLGNPYPKRFSLASFKAANFEMKYGDGRDTGYICSWQEYRERVDWSILTHGTLKLITDCFVPSMMCALFGDE